MSDLSLTISGTKRLLTAGKYCDKNIVVTAEGGDNFIEVDELPTENIVSDAFYKLAKPKLVDVIYISGKYTKRAMPHSDNFYYVKTKPTENIAVTSADGNVANPYYVEDENDVFFYIDGEWSPFSAMADMVYKGTVTNAADATEAGYYAVLGTEYEYYKYINEVEDIVWVRNGTATKVSTLIYSSYFFTIPTKTTEGILKSDAGSTAYFYYIEDEGDIFRYNNDWISASFHFGTLRGSITDIADATEEGYYILHNSWDKYAMPDGTLAITENGTHDISEYASVNVNVPTGGGECDKPHVIPVDELPTENIDTNAVYLCKGAYYIYAEQFLDVVVANHGFFTSIKETSVEYGTSVNFHIATTRPTENILSTTDTVQNWYYIVDEKALSVYGDGAWQDLSCDGTVSNTSEIPDDISATYAVINVGWTKYLAPTGTLEITESGTYDVSEYASAEVNVESGGVVEEYDGTVVIE